MTVNLDDSWTADEIAPISLGFRVYAFRTARVRATVLLIKKKTDYNISPYSPTQLLGPALNGI